MSANVCTLQPSHEQRSYAKFTNQTLLSRPAVLEYQFHEAAADIVCVQEGRARTAVTRNGSFFTMFTAAANKAGSHGVQVWVSKACNFNLHTSRIMSPRLMGVVGALESKGCDVRIISGHAPCEDDSIENKTQFYDDLQVLFDQLGKGPVQLTFLGVDANARVGSVASECFGDLDRAIENNNGSLLRAFLSANSLFAANTFFPVGYTWRSAKGPTARIDYVCTQLAAKPALVDSCVPRNVDLSLCAKEDHRAVAATFEAESLTVSFPAAKRPKREPNCCINKLSLSNPSKCDRFMQAMWKFKSPLHLPIGQHLEELNRYVIRNATKAFGKPYDKPVKPWISDSSWSIIKWVAPMRRIMHRVAETERSRVKHLAWAAWKSLLFLTFNPGIAISTIPNRGWFATARFKTIRKTTHQLALMRTSIYLFIARLRPMIAVLVMRDRLDFLHKKAFEAQCAAHNGDAHTTFSIVKMLAGSVGPTTKCVKLADGTIANNENERQRRWQEHFCNVFNGEVTTLQGIDDNPPAHTVTVHDFRVSPESSRTAFAALGRNKGCGPDTIPAEVLQAGDSALAVKYADLEARIVSEEVIPRQWRGGRIIDLFKRKGDQLVCDNSRGLLLSDHSSKGFAGQLKAFVDPAYELAMPPNQHGGTKGRGTDFASHIVRSLLDIAHLKGWSVFVLFLDLIKAYDRVVRELVLGWPPFLKASGYEYLIALGIDSIPAKWITHFVNRTGGLLQLWGVDPKVRKLIASMHAESWFRYADLDTIIKTALGGRQGCKFGSLIFNGGYAIALSMLHDDLDSAGVALTVHESPEAFWAQEGTDLSSPLSAIDATFVDDEGLVIMAPSPHQLDISVDKLLSAVVRVFQVLSLDINWKPGKSECMLRYRGKRAAAKYDKRRRDGKLWVQVRDLENCYLSVVQCYKHLGGMVTIGSDCVVDANHKYESAMCAYAPLAVKVFGDPSVTDFLKLQFAQSLVHSRLFFNAHIIVPTPRYVEILNRGYMRVLRRICGTMNFDGTAGSDLLTRSQSSQPSVDCVLQRLRLRYLRRLLIRAPVTLLALLHSKHGESKRQLPWTKLIVEDLQCLRSGVQQCSQLPNPADDAKAWTDFILSDEMRWESIVMQLFFTESVCDAWVSEETYNNPSLETSGFTCQLCVGSAAKCHFPSAKALQQHARVKHGDRVNGRNFVDANGVCPACGTDFRERFRCIAHLSDSRRQKCLHVILAMNMSPLSEERIKQLDESDKVAKREARKKGHSHILATGSALTSHGKRIGYVQK